MDMLVTIIFLAVLVESITEIVKLLYKDGKFNYILSISIVVGILVAFTAGLDIFIFSGIEPQLPNVGIIATGLIIARGGNATHDFISKIRRE